MKENSGTWSWKKKKQGRVEKRRAGVKRKMGFFSKSKKELGRKTRSVSLREKKKTNGWVSKF